MIIHSSSPEGGKTIIYDKDGEKIILPIKIYNTETKEAEIYILEENGKVKMSEWEYGKNDKGLTKMSRYALTENKIFEGSYAEIDGNRVE